MEKEEIAALVHSFDNFVEASLKDKTFKGEEGNLQDTQLEHYLISMEKRLKLKSPSHEERFEKIINPMKTLKSFVSVREFLEKLGGITEKGKRKRTKDKKIEMTVKQQYQIARGGYYLEKIEEHLKRQKFSRKQQSGLISQLEDDPFHRTDYCSWMENTLGRISPKQTSLFRVSTEAKEVQKVEEDDCLLQEHKETYNEQFKVVPHIREMCNQEYQNFTKISSLLTNRLRKLLKSNHAPRNILCQQPVPPPKTINPRYFSQRARSGVKKNKDKGTAQLMRSVCRAQTAGSSRKEEVGWIQNVKSRIKNILEVESSKRNAFD